MSWEHHIDTICCIVSNRLSLLRRIKPYLHFGSALGFSNPCVKKYFIFVLLPGETAPTISSYDSFVFRSVLGVYSLMPTSLRLLSIDVWNWSGSPFFISLNTGNFFFSALSLIPMLLIASGTDFDFFFIRVDLWAVIQEHLSLTWRRLTHNVTQGNARMPIVLLNSSMT